MTAVESTTAALAQLSDGQQNGF